jgi:general secretion pathway protein M
MMIKVWWDQRNQRERLFLISGATLLALLLFYFSVWLPFQNNLSGLRQSVVRQRSDLARMQQLAGEIRYLEKRSPDTTSAPAAAGSQSGAGPPSSANTPSLPTLVDQTARAAGLGGALKRVEPQSDNSLQVQFEQAGFDMLLHWLNRLLQDHGIVILNVIVSKQEAPGRVNARLLLQKQRTGP